MAPSMVVFRHLVHVKASGTGRTCVLLSEIVETGRGLQRLLSHPFAASLQFLPQVLAATASAYTTRASLAVKVSACTARASSRQTHVGLYSFERILVSQATDVSIPHSDSLSTEVCFLCYFQPTSQTGRNPVRWPCDADEAILASLSLAVYWNVPYATASRIGGRCS